MTRILGQLRQLKNELEALKLKSARSGIDGGIASQKTIIGTTVISAQVNGVDPSEPRELAVQIGAEIASGIVVPGVASSGKVALAVLYQRSFRRSSAPGTL
jgi:alanyl-tRNA synthetase